MSLIKRKESKIEAHNGVVTCPNCGARIKLKTMESRYIVLLLFLIVIFASIIYLYRNVSTTSSTSLSSSQQKTAEAMFRCFGFGSSNIHVASMRETVEKIKARPVMDGTTERS